MATAGPVLAPNLKAQADALFARKRLVNFGALAVILAYFVYVFFAFDITGLAERARTDKAAILLSDAYSYKTHVTHDNRNGGLTFAVEGENKGSYPAGMVPDFVTMAGEDRAEIALPRSHAAVIDGSTLVFTVPDYGDANVTVDGRDIQLDLPTDTLPGWISASGARVDITTDGGRAIVTRARTEVYRHAFGWELFWFTLDSPFHGRSVSELVGLAVSGPQLVEGKSNLVAMAHDVWNNAMWRHKDVIWAIFETILMAFLGSMGAALVALPLAFVAAKNFSRLAPVRFAVRRVFDFVRGEWMG